MIPGDRGLGTATAQRPPSHVTPGHRRGLAQARHHPLERTRMGIEPCHRRPVSHAGTIEYLYDCVLEVRIVYPPAKLQLDGPLVKAPPHDEGRVVKVGRDEDRPGRRGRPAHCYNQVPGSVAAQIEVAPLHPFGHPLDNAILAACRGRYPRQRHEPLAVLGSS